MSRLRGRILGLSICLVGLLALAVQPVLADGRTVNPPPGAAKPPITAEPAAHVPLADLLAFIPDTENHRAWLSYGDINGWHVATGVPHLSTMDDLESLNDDARTAWLEQMPLQTSLAREGLAYLARDDMRPAYGFNFLDVAQVLEAGNPPDALTFVTLNAPATQVAAALVHTGYTQKALHGATLYGYGDDYAPDLDAPSAAGRLGALNRIAILDSDAPGSRLLIARATPLVTAAVASGAGAGDSLYADRIYATLVDALEGGSILTGTLVGLIVQDGMEPVDLDAARNSGNEAMLAQVDRLARDPLAPYRLRAYATWRDGADTYLTVLIAMAGAGDAQESAAILGDRLGDYVSTLDWKPLSDQWEVVMTGSYESQARLAWVTLKLKSESSLSWMEMIMRRDLLFLYTE